MIGQKEHIDLLLRRIAVIVFFLIVLFISKNNDRNNLDSVENRVEFVSKIDNKAILVSTASFQCIDITFTVCDLNKFIDFRSDKFVIDQFKIKVDNLLQTCNRCFTDIKPFIHNFNNPQVKTYIDSEDKPLIS